MFLTMLMIMVMRMLLLLMMMMVLMMVTMMVMMMIMMMMLMRSGSHVITPPSRIQSLTGARTGGPGVVSLLRNYRQRN